MATDPKYFVTSDVDTFFVDRSSGLPLSNGTLEFYRDVARNVPKPVYEINGATPNYNYDTELPNPLTLSAVGTAQNAAGANVVIYYKPYIIDPSSGQEIVDLYYVVGKDQNGNVQFTREAWPTINSTGSTPPTSQAQLGENQISNPTFSNILINKGTPSTFVFSGPLTEIEIAPDWTLVVQGNGTVIVQQSELAGSAHIVSNPPYALDIEVSAGITSCSVRQRFNANSGLWSGSSGESIYLAGSYVARSVVAGPVSLTMFYEESSGNPPQQILTGSLNNGFQRIVGISNAIPLSGNTNTGQNAWVDIYVSIPTNTHVQLTAIQLIPTLSSTLDSLPEDFNSTNKNQAFQGDYFIPRLNARTTSSLLTGWDFTVSPKQFGGSGTITTTSGYIVDQTISAVGVGGTLTFAPNAETRGITFLPTSANNAFYVLQYLNGADAKKIIGTRLSVNVFGWQANAGTATVRVYLFRTGSTGTIPISTTGASIGDVSTTGIFTLDVTRGANWTEIPRSGLQTAQATMNAFSLANISSPKNDYGFSGWQLTSTPEIQDTDKFAIVVTCAYVNSGCQIVLNSISLVPGDIPCRPAAQSSDEVLRRCQYYYEKTYEPNVLPGTSTLDNVIHKTQAFSVLSLAGPNPRLVFPSPFSLNFYTPKINIPNVSFYSSSGSAAGNVQAFLSNAATGTINSTTAPVASNWNVVKSKRAVFFTPAGTAVALNLASMQSDLGLQGNITFHYVADSRLGVV